ncbi:uncharacterized protein BYT42DRAFT_586058 [Radiomyces spectabilis]|uniref:uncharacterized protein n=1 Tax=Radiomyces spectabilis TaxID=64574 RepID=UPI00221E3CB4|nr:uncharacterized protein BYT42DRAFT_586058 [Radiomyces spectabilis]KAI8368293.1 hypothetical protein BYT42DRAFT_586058 [Radiomyces spectabilis]
MSSHHQKKHTETGLKNQENEYLEDAKMHVNETETALDDMERASQAHEKRTGKKLEVNEDNALRSRFKEENQ